MKIGNDIHFVSSLQITLLTVNGEGLLPGKLANDLMKRFDEIYEYGVQEIQRNLDHIHFGYDSMSLLKSENHRKQVISVGTAVSWRALTEKGKDEGLSGSEGESRRWKCSECGLWNNRQRIRCQAGFGLVSRQCGEGNTTTDVDDQCRESGQCVAAHRISLVMDLFKKHFLKQVVYKKKNEKPSESQYLDLFTQCLNDYDAVSLLNDYDHIRSNHTRDANDWLRDCEEPGMYTECSQTLQMLRQLSDDHNSSYWNLMNSLSIRQRVLLEITIKIHSFLNHTESDETDFKEKVNDKCDDVAVIENDTMSKFVIEADSSECFTFKNTKMDGLSQCFLWGGASKEECASVLRRVGIEQFDTDAIQYDLATIQQHVESTRTLPLDGDAESNLSSMLSQHRHGILKRLIFHFWTPSAFKFGNLELKHWKHFEKRKDYIKSPKYTNLKEESLNNSIHSISITTFNQILVKSLIHQRSNTGKRMKARNNGRSNSIYEIPAKSPVSTAHIMVVIMYTDLTDLQKEYKKKGCRTPTIQTHSDLEEFKALHGEISWWYKLLWECVTFWGEETTPMDTFYTGLNCRLVFDSLAPKFLCPISTTICESVAHRFSKGYGLILKMKPSASLADTYLNVEWLSSFGEQEKERLFVRALSLFVVDIQSFDGGKRMKIQQYVECFILFSSLFKGHFITPILKERKGKSERMLLCLIRQHKRDVMVGSEVAKDNEAPKFSFFVEQLFNHLLSEFRNRQYDNKRLYLISSEYNLLSDDLRNELVSLPSKKGHKPQMSPFLGSLNCRPNDVVLMQEFMWSLDLEAFQQYAFDQRMYSGEEFVCTVGDSGTMTFKLYAERRTSGSEYTGFGFKITEMSFASISGFYSVDIQEAEWYLNECRFSQLIVGGYKGTFAFKDLMSNEMNSLTIRFAMYLKE